MINATDLRILELEHDLFRNGIWVDLKISLEMVKVANPFWVKRPEYFWFNLIQSIVVPIVDLFILKMSQTRKYIKIRQKRS